MKISIFAFTILICLCLWYIGDYTKAHETNQDDATVKDSKSLISDSKEKAGVNFAVSQSFLDSLTRGILPKIWDIINQQIVVKGKTISIKVANLFTVYFNILEFVLSDVYYDSTLTNVTLFEKNNSIGFHINNSSIHFNLTYKLHLDPEILADNGTIKYASDHFKMNLIFGMTPRPEDPKKAIVTISENEMEFDPKLTFVNLTNINDFGNLMMDTVKVFKYPIISLVQGLFSNYLEYAINLAITYIPNPFVNDDTEFDLSLIKWPMITGEFLPIQIVGKFSPIGKTLPFENMADMPDFYTKGESLQMFISEFTIKSLLFTLMNNGKLIATSK